MSNERDELDSDCRCTSKRMQEFYYWKYCKELYLDSLKIGTFDIVKDGNYAEYFVKKYLFGKFYYDIMSNFNKRVVFKLKQPKYASYIDDQTNKINDKFNLDKFQFIINPMEIEIESFINIEITERNIQNAELCWYNVIHDKNRPKEYNDETLGLVGAFSFKILSSKYDSKLYPYIVCNNVDRGKQIFRISLSNFKDNEGKIYQVISLILNTTYLDIKNFSHMIVFYYTPNEHSTYNSNIASKDSYLNFANHDVDCLLNHFYGEFATYDATLLKDRIHLYRCEKPIFDENQLKILRTYSFIANKSQIETDKLSNRHYFSNPIEKSETAKYCERLLKNKYPNLSSLELQKQMFKDYPMYVPLYFKQVQECENIHSLSTQSVKQLFFSTILRILNNIENNIPTNSFKQDKSYLSDSFVSSRDALIPLYSKDSTIQNKLIICNNTTNYTMIMNKMLFDATEIDDLR